MPDFLLIENGTVLTGGKTPAVLRNHSVLIENGYISRIAGAKQFRRFAGKRLDASQKLVMPGLINAHTHFYSTFVRGLTKTRPAGDFLEVLRNLWWRLDKALTVEDCYYSALVPLIEAIRHGTTALIDHHASPNAVRGSLAVIEKAVKETGLRACLCYELSDRDGAQISREGIEENVAFIRSRRRNAAPSPLRGTLPSAARPQPDKKTGKGEFKDGKIEDRKILLEEEEVERERHTSRHTPRASALPASGNGRIAALFGLHAAFTLKDSTLAEAAALGRELGTGFHIHVAEAQSDQQFSQRHHGLRVVERLNKFDILGPQSIAAHCVHVNGKELDLLRETQTAVVHNPQSNMNNAVGVADLIAMRKRRVLVGLGTDAMTTNMLEELRVALWAQHLSADDPSVGFSEVVSALFFNNPAIASRVFDLPLGELREGCAGDVVVMDYDPPTPMTADNCFGHLVFGISQSVVDSTIVGGKVLMQNKRLKLDLDEQQINARAREQARKLWARL
jgi:cytosine/adenosine deaminase-related metal-dependent hydrolase